MTAPIDDFRASIQRRAIELEIGGFRLPENPLASWFGCVTYGLPGEEWPCTDGVPLLALCQINLTELPFRPPRLDDLEFLTVFISADELPSDDANGTNWCLRAYRNISELVPLAEIATNSPIKPFPMRPKIVEQDYPCLEDMPIEMSDEVCDTYYDLFSTASGFKLGGWPSLIQSEIYWAPWQKHPAQPEYVFQIDTTEKGNWMWGDNGVAYFGRGTEVGHRDEWAMEWQCY